MIVLHDAQNQNVTYPLIVDDDKWFILHRLDGEDELEFELSLEDPMTAKIFEEMLVDANGNQYVIKNVDEHSNFMTVTCVVNLDDFKAQFHEHVLYRNAYLYDVLSDILPTGWSLAGDVSLARKATIGSDDGVAMYDNLNSYDVLFLAQTAYGVTFNFNVIAKTLTVIDRSEVQSSGSYLMEDLNLESVGYVGSTKNFATRLYAYGKTDEETGQPLTFASINDGKEYVEDHSYSNKVISVGWTDERYTVKENLLADARKRLAALASPSRSYACNAKNVLDDVYVTKVITLVDKRRRQRVDHMVVEWKEYSRSDMDVITLSQSEPSITKSLGEQFKELKREVGMGDTMMKAFVNDAIADATDAITGNKGGVFKWIFDAQGRPIELLNLGDTYDPSTARKVWRWNAAGLGHSNTGYDGLYDLALLADGSINASVITTGTLNADIIRAGRIQDVTASNYWDLETGVMQFSKGRITSADGKNYWEVQGGALHIERGEIGGYTIASDKIYNNHVELDAGGLKFYAYNTSDGVERKVLVSSLLPGWLSSQSGDVYGSLQMRIPMNFQLISITPYDQTSQEVLVFNYARNADGTSSAQFRNFTTLQVDGDVLFGGSTIQYKMSNVEMTRTKLRGYGSVKLGDNGYVFGSAIVYGTGKLLPNTDASSADDPYLTNPMINAIGAYYGQYQAVLTGSNLDSLGRYVYVNIGGSNGYITIGRHFNTTEEPYSGTASMRITETSIFCWLNSSQTSSDNRRSFILQRNDSGSGRLYLYDASDTSGQKRIYVSPIEIAMRDDNNATRCWVDYAGIQCRNSSDLKRMNLNLSSLSFYDDSEVLRAYVSTTSHTTTGAYGMRLFAPGFVILGADEVGVSEYYESGASGNYTRGMSGSVRVAEYAGTAIDRYLTITFFKGIMVTDLS